MHARRVQVRIDAQRLVQRRERAPRSLHRDPRARPNPRVRRRRSGSPPRGAAPPLFLPRIDRAAARDRPRRAAPRTAAALSRALARSSRAHRRARRDSSPPLPAARTRPIHGVSGTRYGFHRNATTSKRPPSTNRERGPATPLARQVQRGMAATARREHDQKRKRRETKARGDEEQDGAREHGHRRSPREIARRDPCA